MKKTEECIYNIKNKILVQTTCEIIMTADNVRILHTHLLISLDVNTHIHVFIFTYKVCLESIHYLILMKITYDLPRAMAS